MGGATGQATQLHERLPSAAGRRPVCCIGLLGNTVSKTIQGRIVKFLGGKPLRLFRQCHARDRRGDLVASGTHHRDSVELPFHISHLTTHLVVSGSQRTLRPGTHSRPRCPCRSAFSRRHPTLAPPHRHLAAQQQLSCTSISFTHRRVSDAAFPGRGVARRHEDVKAGWHRSPREYPTGGELQVGSGPNVARVRLAAIAVTCLLKLRMFHGGYK